MSVQQGRTQVKSRGVTLLTHRSRLPRQALFPQGTLRA